MTDEPLELGRHHRCDLVLDDPEIAERHLLLMERGGVLMALTLTPGEGERPGGTAAVQRTITATIEAIDMSVPSITFTGPSGWKYSRRVEDKATLAKVKVGDRVDMTWTEAVVLDVESKK